MENEDDRVALSPTVLKVFAQFFAAMRADNGIEEDAIERLEKLLQKSTGSALESGQN